MRQILIDTGPLVALLDEGDQDHGRCVQVAKQLPATLLTTWPVVTEAMYLLSEAPSAQDALLAKVEDGSVGVVELDVKDVPSLRLLMRKYRELPIDLADASLVRVAGREGIQQIFTLDRRDFNVYRTTEGRPFTIVP